MEVRPGTKRWFVGEAQREIAVCARLQVREVSLRSGCIVEKWEYLRMCREEHSGSWLRRTRWAHSCFTVPVVL